MALIIDMEMPKACVWEKASNVLDVCNMIHRCPYAKASAEKRPEGCLIKGEIPDKHGALKDANALKELTKNTEIRNSRGEIYPIGKAIAKMIDEAPTVVESEDA